MGKRLSSAVAVTAATAVFVGLALSSCENPVGPERRTPSLPAVVVVAASTNVLVGAGDVASCSTNLGDENTAAVINPILNADATALVFNVGDMVYENGTAAEYQNCYDPQSTWGKFKARTKPVLGNHEYNVSVKPSFDYWGSALGQRNKGY